MKPYQFNQLTEWHKWVYLLKNPTSFREQELLKYLISLHNPHQPIDSLYPLSDIRLTYFLEQSLENDHRKHFADRYINERFTRFARPDILNPPHRIFTHFRRVQGELVFGFTPELVAYLSR